MEHQKNKSGSGRKKGKGVVATFVKENDDSTSGDEEAKILEKLLGSTDILSEIFSRLPPRTLFRFSCISKDLCNLIGGAEFAALHSRNCKLVAGRAITGMFIQEILYNESDARYSDGGKIQFKNTVEWEVGALPDPWLGFLNKKSTCDKVHIIDSCNGLLLCSSTTYGRNGKTRLFVCNPLTRQKVGLPLPRKPPSKSKSRKEEEARYECTYALMADLDHHRINYKVVCLSWSRSTSPYSNYCDVKYSELVIWFSETGQWVELGIKLPPPSSSHFFQLHFSSRVFFKESLYWDCLEGHILVCPFKVKPGEPYTLIDAPPAPGRSLWISENKLHCYCHGFKHEFPEWTLSMNGKWELLQDSEIFRNLTDDVSDQVAALYWNRWTTETGRKQPRNLFKIIVYAPQSKTFFLLIQQTVYIYYLDEKRLEHIGGFKPPEDRTISFRGRCSAKPYVHRLVPIQTAKTAGNPLGGAMLIQNRRVDHEAETGFETKKVRGTHNKRTPK